MDNIYVFEAPKWVLLTYLDPWGAVFLDVLLAMPKGTQVHARLHPGAMCVVAALDSVEVD